MMKNRFSARISLYLFIIVITISCNKTTEEILPTEPVKIDLSSEQINLIQAENKFAFDIFKKIIESTPASRNIIISPLSISYALSMTLNGANGPTREAMLEALRAKGISPDNINNSYKNLSGALLNVDKRVNISIANSVWIENNFIVKKSFTSILTDFYYAESRSFGVADPMAPKQINSWIESKTNGLIKEMVDKLNDNTVMLLINAIYFKGKWKSQFDPKNTVQKPFYKSDGTSSEVRMMKQTSNFKIFPGQGFILAEFPYGQGNFVMDIILPNVTNGITGIISSLNDGNFNGWINKMAERKTDLTFPRFKYGFKKQLKETLTNLGMGIAFSDNADFSNISDADLLINDVTHQAFIETNEEGSEAAAATIVDIGLTSYPPSNLILNIDHSFIYIIREITTNTILFMGTVVDPISN
jgi:serine protease inhibitor